MPHLLFEFLMANAGAESIQLPFLTLDQVGSLNFYSKML